MSNAMEAVERAREIFDCTTKMINNTFDRSRCVECERSNCNEKLSKLEAVRQNRSSVVYKS